MQMQYGYRAIDKEFHEPWQRALGNVIEHALKPLGFYPVSTDTFK